VTKQTRRARAGQPMTADPYALHRVDSAYLEGSHARMVAGHIEQIEFAGEEPAYDLRGTTYEDDEDSGIVAIAIVVTCLAIAVAVTLAYTAYFFLR
jgi:hypothetical protein